MEKKVLLVSGHDISQQLKRLKQKASKTIFQHVAAGLNTTLYADKTLVYLQKNNNYIY